MNVESGCVGLIWGSTGIKGDVSGERDAAAWGLAEGTRTVVPSVGRNTDVDVGIWAPAVLVVPAAFWGGTTPAGALPLGFNMTCPAAESARPAESDIETPAAEPLRAAADAATPDPLPPSPAVPAVVRLHAASVHIAIAITTAEVVAEMVFAGIAPPPRLPRLMAGDRKRCALPRLAALRSMPRSKAYPLRRWFERRVQKTENGAWHMADRGKTHNGRDVDGRFRVRQADVDDLLDDPQGVDLVRDDVRLGGAVADVGPNAGLHAREIGHMIDENRDDVMRATGKAESRSGKRGRKR
jgi:hypothetical protein